MKVATVTKKEYTLEEHEARLVLTILDYARHRLSTEQSTGLHKAHVRKTQVEKLASSLHEAIAAHD